jgi:hypothetical protein
MIRIAYRWLYVESIGSIIQVQRFKGPSVVLDSDTTPDIKDHSSPTAYLKLFFV